MLTPCLPIAMQEMHLESYLPSIIPFLGAGLVGQAHPVSLAQISIMEDTFAAAFEGSAIADTFDRIPFVRAQPEGVSNGLAPSKKLLFTPNARTQALKALTASNIR